MKQIRLSKADVEAIKLAIKIILDDYNGVFTPEIGKRLEFILNRLEKLK